MTISDKDNNAILAHMGKIRIDLLDKYCLVPNAPDTYDTINTMSIASHFLVQTISILTGVYEGDKAAAYAYIQKAIAVLVLNDSITGWLDKNDEKTKG